MDNLNVRGEVSYKSNSGAERVILKLNHRPQDIKPDEIPIGVRMKEEKCPYVNQLLIKHFGDNWKSLHNLEWYKRVIEEQQANFGRETDSTKDKCECMDVPETDEDELILMDIN